MSRRSALVAVFVLLCTALVTTSEAAPNLVPNGGFENKTSCPSGSPSVCTLPTAVVWRCPNTATSDYFNRCGTGFYHVPVQPGNLDSHSGDGFIGFIPNSPRSDTINWAEYAQVRLSEPLRAGVTYHAEMYLALNYASDTSQVFNAVEAGYLGMYFSSWATRPTSNTYHKFAGLYPQVTNATRLTDHLIWTKTSGCFVAEGGEEALTIGIFPSSISGHEGIECDVDVNDCNSYVFCDDVAVSEADLSVDLDIPTQICADGEVLLRGSGGHGAENYYVEICPVGQDCNVTGWSQWFSGQPTTLNLAQYFNFQAGMSYNIKLAVQSVCNPFLETTKVVTAVPPMQASFTEVSPLQICQSYSLTPVMTAGGGGPYTFQWSRAHDGLESLLPDTSQTLQLDPAASTVDGIYTVTVHDAAGCNASASIRVEGVCGEVAAWSDLGVGVTGPTPFIDAVQYYDNGFGPKLYAGGSFQWMNGQIASGIAQFKNGDWAAVGPNLSGVVHALAVFRGELYAGGEFVISGVPGATNLARWNGSIWKAVGSGTDGAVYVLRTHNDGGSEALYVGGAFTSAGGSVVHGIARWNGSSWSALGTGITSPNWEVRALASQVIGGVPTLVVGGTFTSAGGIPVDNVALWSQSAWQSVAPLNNTVRALEVFDDGTGASIYAGGSFTGGIAKLSVGGGTSSWSVVGGGLSGPYHDALCLESVMTCNGPVLYAGGMFDVAGGAIVHGIARWDGLSWNPVANGVSGSLWSDYFGVHDIVSGGRTLIVGGAFTHADSKYMGGIAQFACSPLTAVHGWHMDRGPWRPRVDSVAVAKPTDFTSPVEVRHRFIFGGQDGGGFLNDTWELTGTGWVEVPSPVKPSPRAGHSMVFDRARNVVVMFGGDTAGGPSGETWEFDGTTWVLRSSSGPEPRFYAGMAYDAARSRTVLYGGDSGTGRYDDTWEWDGVTWTMVAASSAPGRRSRHAMAYEETRGVVVMFGGEAPGSVLLGDTWTWNGSSWVAQSMSGPSARRFHVMTWDPINARVLLTGGEDASGLNGETWAFQNGAWRQLSVGTFPPRRSHMAWVDEESRELVVMGGFDGSYSNAELRLGLVTEPPSLPLSNSPGVTGARVRRD